MKRLLTVLVSVCCVLAAAAQDVVVAGSETQLNSEYQAAISQYLETEVAARQKQMQRRAEQWLVALPNNEKLYDETYISVGARIGEGLTPEGVPEKNLVFDIAYGCKHLEGWTDDYPLGVYAWDSSNSVRAICRLTKMFVEGMMDDWFRAGKRVSVRITSTTDGTELAGTIAYGGEYGDFRYMPTTFNGERLRVSVDAATGINNNCQLAYIRAQSVRWFLENNVRNLGRTVNDYEFTTRSFADTGAHYRRSSIELTVHDAFRETIDLMTADKIQDDYVDFNIPQAMSTYENAYVLVVANEDYDAAFLPSVPFAGNDGEMVRRYFVRALGVPERQVKLLKNASKDEILREGVHWLTDLAQAVATKNGDQTEAQADVFIYYAGHGYTDFNDVSYLVPNRINVDGIKSLGGKKKGCFGSKKKSQPVTKQDIALGGKESGRLTKELLSIEALLGAFKGYPVRNLTMVVDASFDGRQRNGGPMLRADRKVDPKAKKRKRKMNLRSDAVVLLAADFDKTAYAFDAQHHGFLTYFLLKEVKGMAGAFENYTYQDIYESVERKLNKESALQGRWQEIGGVAGGKYKEAWRQLKIKN